MHDITLGTGYGKNGFSKALCTHTQSHWENQGVPDTFRPPKPALAYNPEELGVRGSPVHTAEK